METYLLKSSLALVVLYGIYRAIVHWVADHRMNRFLGLACVAFSVSFALVAWESLITAKSLNQTIQTLAVNAADLETEISPVFLESTISRFLVVYYCGVAFFALRWLIGMVSLIFLFSNSRKDNHWGFRVINVDREISPFTFFNLLFVGKQTSQENQMHAIVVHEKIHRDHFHSVDAVLLELLTIVFWFHPFMWLFRRDIKAEHEYFADQEVLRTGVSTLDYQKLLFEARTGISLRFGSYFRNTTSLTKRFWMMTKTKTNSAITRLLSATLVLALMVSTVIFSAFSSQTETQIDREAKYVQGHEALYNTIRQMITYPASARNANRVGTINVAFTVNEEGKVENPSVIKTPKGYVLNEVVVVGHSKYTEVAKEVDDVLKAEGIRVVASLGKFVPAQKDGKAVSSLLTLPIQFKLQ